MYDTSGVLNVLPRFRLPFQATWTRVLNTNTLERKEGKQSYTLTAKGSGTTAEFSLTIDPKVPIPGFLVRRAEKMALETAGKGLKSFTEKNFR